MEIAAAVGAGRPNRPSDVRTVQLLLNRANRTVSAQVPLAVDGLAGPLTTAAITQFQARVMRFGKPDGIVDPHGPTLRTLSRQAAPPSPRPRPAAPKPAPRQAGSGASGTGPGGLSEASYVDAASRLQCEVAAVKAVVQTEVAIRGAFDALGRPTILFERHKFHHHTHGRFAKSDPDICNPVAGGYGRFTEQYPKLERAMKLDRVAALQSASWGAFQIMGENHRQAGYASVDAFVAAMKASIEAQVQAFVAFVLADRLLLLALRQRNWTSFARIYNGPGYARNHYDQTMRTNYQRFSN